MESLDTWTRPLAATGIVDRDDFLIELAKGRSILHLGAANSPYTRQDAEAGTLLHLKLAKVARDLIGVDSDLEAVDYLRSVRGIAGLLTADACHLPEEVLRKGPFELIYCCDLIEHLDSPGALLDGVRTLMGDDSLLVVTTINALALKPALRVLIWNRESVHPDHTAYYSYSTLSCLLARYGYRILRCSTFAYGTSLRFLGQALGALYRLRPHAADGILLVATKDRS
jgi:hypothetical protein